MTVRNPESALDMKYVDIAYRRGNVTGAEMSEFKEKWVDIMLHVIINPPVNHGGRKFLDILLYIGDALSQGPNF